MANKFPKTNFDKGTTVENNNNQIKTKTAVQDDLDSHANGLMPE